MKITRSSKCSLRFLTASKNAQLLEVMEEYSSVVNFFIDIFWQNSFKKKDLTKEIYNLPCTWLSARMKQCAAREALSMCQSNDQYRNKSILEMEVEQLLDDNTAFNEKIKPHHHARRMILSSQIVSVEPGKNTFDIWVILSSIGKKINLSIPIKKHRHFNQFSGWKLSSSIVITRKYIQFSFEKEVEPKKESGVVIGMDVGINHLIATSEKEFIGNDIKTFIGVIKRKKQGSKAYIRAKKTLKYHMNKVVKDYFGKTDLRLIVVEKLDNLKRSASGRSKEFRKTLSNWNYRELLEIIQKHTENNRVSFRSVNPYKTSQMCPECNHTQRENRNGENFKCLKCGFSEQADYVGSLNIRDRFLTGRYGACFQT
jgi:IS605 OrfB family transposase